MWQKKLSLYLMAERNRKQAGTQYPEDLPPALYFLSLYSPTNVSRASYLVVTLPGYEDPNIQALLEAYFMSKPQYKSMCYVLKFSNLVVWSGYIRLPSLPYKLKAENLRNVSKIIWVNGMILVGILFPTPDFILFYT